MKGWGELFKRIIKRAVATHLARMQQLDEFPSLQRNSQYKRCHEANLHNVDMLPFSWQSNIQKVFKKIEGKHANIYRRRI